MTPKFITPMIAVSPLNSPEWFGRRLVQVAWLFLAIGTLLRVGVWLLNSPIWGDESFIARNVLNHDYAGLAGHLDHHQIAPLLFLWIERAMAQTFGHSEMVLRLYPLVSAIAAMFLFWKFARKTLPLTAAVTALGFLAVAAWPVFLSATIKPYAPDLLWSTVMFWLGWRWIEEPEELLRSGAALLFAGVVLWGSYPVVFVAGSISLTLLPELLRRSWRFRAIWGLYNLIVLASFAGHYLLVGRAQVGEDAGEVSVFYLRYWSPGFPPDSPLAWPLWFLQANTGRMFAYPLGEKCFGSTITTILFVVGCVTMWRQGNRKLLAMLLLPFALTLVAACLKKYPYGACCRLSQHLTLSICLCSGLGLTTLAARVARTWKTQWVLIRLNVAVMTVIATGYMMSAVYKPYYNTEADWSRKVVREINRQMAPGDTLVASNEKSNCRLSPMMMWGLEKDHPLTWNGEIPPEATGRIWVLNTWINPAVEPYSKEIDKLMALRRPNWKLVGRTRYALPPAKGEPEPVFQAEIAVFDPPGARKCYPPVFSVSP